MLILLQVQEGHPGLDVRQGKDEGPGFPEQLMVLWWRLPADCGREDRISLWGASLHTSDGCC